MNEKIIGMSFLGLGCALNLDLHPFILDLLIHMILGVGKWFFFLIFYF